MSAKNFKRLEGTKSGAFWGGNCNGENVDSQGRGRMGVEKWREAGDKGWRKRMGS